MLFSNSLDSLPGNVTFDTTILDEVSSITFLGVCVDNKLSWKCHINNICKTISRNIGVMNKLKYCLPTFCIKNALLKLNTTVLKLWGPCLGQHISNMFRQTLSTAKRSAQDCFQPPYTSTYRCSVF